MLRTTSIEQKTHGPKTTKGQNGVDIPMSGEHIQYFISSLFSHYGRREKTFDILNI